MINASPRDNNAQSLRSFWLPATALFILSVALRWIDLGLITFRYDQAAVAARALDGFPFTGIVNSLGFRNAPGYIWTILPAAVLSPDPRWMTAWHGLLTATMIFPLAILGHRYRSDALRWLPAILAAVLPASILSGRNLWAQYMLPPIIAWALLMLDNAMDERRGEKSRMKAAATSLGLLAWGISVHFSAGPLFLVALCAVVTGFTRSVRKVVMILIPTVLIGLTILPSFLAGINQMRNPAPKPDFAEAYEAVLPDPLPWWARVSDSALYAISNNSFEALIGMDTLLPSSAVYFTNAYDLIVLCLVLAGVAFVLVGLWSNRREGRATPNLERRHRFLLVLLAMLVLPVLMGGLLVKRVNAGYFPGCLPVGWLMVIALPTFVGRWNHLARVLGLYVMAGGAAIFLMFFEVIRRADTGPGSYYITYRAQAKVVEYLNANGVAKGQFNHLAGDWYGRSYRYIHDHVLTDVAPAEGKPYAIMEDQATIPGKNAHVEFFWGRNPAEFGTVGVLIFPSRGPAEIFSRDYYALTLDQSNNTPQ